MMRDDTIAYQGDGLTEAQVTAAVALITRRPVEAVRGYVLVAISDKSERGSGLTVVSSVGSNRRLCAEILRHAAAHMENSCLPCLRKSRRMAGRRW